MWMCWFLCLRLFICELFAVFWEKVDHANARRDFTPLAAVFNLPWKINITHVKTQVPIAIMCRLVLTWTQPKWILFRVFWNFIYFDDGRGRVNCGCSTSWRRYLFLLCQKFSAVFSLESAGCQQMGTQHKPKQVEKHHLVTGAHICRSWCCLLWVLHVACCRGCVAHTLKVNQSDIEQQNTEKKLKGLTLFLFHCVCVCVLTICCLFILPGMPERAIYAFHTQLWCGLCASC